MITAFHGIVLAAAIATGASGAVSQPPPEAARQYQANPDQRPAYIAEQAPLAVAKVAQRGEQHLGCKKGQEDRQSDLCAQWKAADAARDGVYWAQLSAFAGLISAGLLFWTLGETRKIGQEQTRAYLSVTRMETVLQTDPYYKTRAPQITLHMTNAGGTPAKNVSFYCGSRVMKVAEREQFRCPDQVPFVSAVPSIAANCTIPVVTGAHASGQAMKDVSAAWKAVTEDTRIGQMPTIILWGSVFYDDVFNKTFRSDFAFIYDDPEREGRRELANILSIGIADDRPQRVVRLLRSYARVRWWRRR